MRDVESSVSAFGHHFAVVSSQCHRRENSGDLAHAEPHLRASSQSPVFLKSVIHHARAGATLSSLRTIGATCVPRIFMARNICSCGSVETPIWNVTREMPPRTSFT